ncbi:APC family permease [Bacillus sp. AK128]
MKNRKIGPILLSGLIIGPILGSGIIILPPAVFESSKEYAIIAWGIILILSFLFAQLFGKLAILYPGDSGISLVIEKAFGKSVKNMSATFFILAVCFGPIAVLSTAGQYLQLVLNLPVTEGGWVTLLLFGLCYIILTRNITSIGKVALFMSSFAVIILLIGSVSTIYATPNSFHLSNPFEIKNFGYSLLLLFWALIGWEVIGSYSLEIRDIEKTIPKTVILSFSIISVVSILVAFAYQQTASSETQSLDLLLSTAFGPWSTALISVITIVLCLSTVLLVIGAVSRLISDQAKIAVLPRFLAYKNHKNVPVNALLMMFAIHVIVVGLLTLQIISVHQLVAMANAFFLCNALLGILASFRLFSELKMKVVCIVLALSFITILLFSSIPIMVTIVLIIVGFMYSQFRENKQSTPETIRSHG